MPPLRLAAVGLLLVLVTISLGGFTLSLDLLGWLMIVGGTHTLAEVNTWFTWSRNLAVAALVLEVVLWISPLQLLSILAGTLSRVAVLAFAVCLCSALLQRLGRGDKAYAVTLQVLRVLIPAVTLAGAAVAVLDVPVGVPVGLFYPVQVAGTVVLAVLMWLLGSRHSFTH
ncbi:hypothetical protein [Micropruina sp.]|uniref:hypothetical protein n=1 Tax=Micropruina sp. TaxID=2737536 RepID=UPI0039E69DD8